MNRLSICRNQARQEESRDRCETLWRCGERSRRSRESQASVFRSTDIL